MSLRKTTPGLGSPSYQTLSQLKLNPFPALVSAGRAFTAPHHKFISINMIHFRMERNCQGYSDLETILKALAQTLLSTTCQSTHI